jgi:hypothetical protein
LQMRENLQLSFSVWLILCNIMITSSTHFPENNIHCGCIPHFLYPFVSWWVLRLFFIAWLLWIVLL